MRGRAALLGLLVVLPVSAQREVRVEYIAHAAFVIESPGGTRIAIDSPSKRYRVGSAGSSSSR